MSKFGDLIGGTVTTTEETAVVETPVCEEVIAEAPPAPPAPPVEPVETEVPSDFDAMSKDELEDYGRTIGIELDRRHNKKKLIKEIEDHIQYIESV
tara:strand:- start:58 stop:345 length:288 start_codon:yes stop_codon:yes gene_type:complete